MFLSLGQSLTDTPLNENRSTGVSQGTGWGKESVRPLGGKLGTFLE